MKIRMVCPHCGDDESVVRDAYASWDVETQTWVLHSVYDDMTCDACGEHDIRAIEEEIVEKPG